MSGFEWDFEKAAPIVKGELVLPRPEKTWRGASIDTRTLKTDQVFFALKGNRQDGHDFLESAFRKGASGAVVKKSFFKGLREQVFRERTLFHNLLLVSRPEEALASLAGAYRRYFSAVGVGVTGSVGKTSTKAFLDFLFSQKYPVLSSRGNRNNHLGLPLTLFELEPEHQYCVAELGANRRGEIRKLSALLDPRVGAITGVSVAHLEGFGSLSHIYEAKLELADHLAQKRGVLVLPDRDRELVRRARKRKIPLLLFGAQRSSDFRLSGLEVREGWIQMEVNDRWRFRFPGHAPFQAENALAALAVAFACGLRPGEFPPLWKDVNFPEGRFEVFSSRPGVVFIHDGYNASPYAFQRSLEAFEAMEPRGRKILVLGDMLELGAEASFYHRELGGQIQQKNFQALLTVGEAIRETTLLCERAGNPPLTLHFEDRALLIHFLDPFLRPGDQVLFKASRAIALEQVMAPLSLAPIRL